MTSDPALSASPQPLFPAPRDTADDAHEVLVQSLLGDRQRRPTCASGIGPLLSTILEIRPGPTFPSAAAM